MFKYRKIWMDWKVLLCTSTQIVDFHLIESKVTPICEDNSVKMRFYAKIFNSFLNCSVLEIASATKTHCDNIYRQGNFAVDPNSFTIDTMLSNMYCTFCNSYIELLAIIYGLKKFLDNHPKVTWNSILKKALSRIIENVSFVGSTDCDWFILVFVPFTWSRCQYRSSDLRSLIDTSNNCRRIQVCGKCGYYAWMISNSIKYHAKWHWLIEIVFALRIGLGGNNEWAHESCDFRGKNTHCTGSGWKSFTSCQPSDNNWTWWQRSTIVCGQYW